MSVSSPTKLTFRLTGLVERQNENFDLATLTVDGKTVIAAHGTDENLGCAMLPIDITATIDVGAGDHEIELACDTIDGRYHVGLFFTLTMTRQPWAMPCTACGRAVEWVRSAKKSNWRLFAGSDLLTRGNYVFTPADVPFFDGPHFLGSRDWVSDDGFRVLGEWEGKTSWSNGATPFPFPRRAPLDPDCLGNGETPGLLTALPLIAGFPAECYAPADAFPDIRAPAFLALIARAIELHQAEDPSAPAKLQQATRSGAAVTDFSITDGPICGGMVQVTPDAVFVCLDGSNDNQAFALQAAFTLLPPANVGHYGTSLVWQGAKAVWDARLGTLAPPPTLPVYFFGHSLGGVVSALLAASYRAWDPNREISVVTYGMPAPGDARLIALLSAVDCVHVANAGDLVTVYPSVLGFLWPEVWVPSVPVFSAWQLWKQPGARLVVTPAGALLQLAEGWCDVAVIVEATVKILAGVPLAPVAAHQIDAYRERLDLAAGP